MSPRGRLLWTGLVLGIVGLAVWIFWSHFEKRPIEVYTGLGGEARVNPYYAAARLLEGMGASVEAHAEMRAFDQLPDPAGSLVFPTQRARVDAELTERLRSWVHAGGHLVVVTWSLYDDQQRQPDLLLDPLDLRQYMQEDPEGLPCAPGEGLIEVELAQDELDCPPAFPPAEVPFDGRVDPLRVAFDPRFSIEDAGNRADWRVADAHGVHLLEYSLGEGRLTVLTDDLWMRNDAIAAHDHAEFLVRALHLGLRGGPVWIVYAEAYPSLLALLAEHAWAPFWAIGLLVGLVLWRWSARFGPLQTSRRRPRRDLSEHLEASARFSWRWSGGRALLAGTRVGLLRELAARHPAWSGADEAKRVRELARRSGMREADVVRALADEAIDDADAFTERVATLEQIRRAL